MNNGAPLRMYDEAHDGTGALDRWEHAAAVTICDHARTKAEAIMLLDMCGLLRREVAS